MIAEPAYEVVCQRPEAGNTRCNWRGKFYFDQPLPKQCPRCNAPVKNESILANKRRRERAEEAERAKQERESRRTADEARTRQLAEDVRQREAKRMAESAADYMA